MQLRKREWMYPAAFCLLTALSPVLNAQGSPSAPSLIRELIDDRHVVRPEGNVRSEATEAANDRGPVDASLNVEHMLLQMRRSPRSEVQIEAYLAELNTVDSPAYHRWLTAAELGERFGPAASDLAAVKGWLVEHGFVVHGIAANGMTIDFSGSASQIRSAFHTTLHLLEVNGQQHIANIENPAIPAVLADVVAGIVSLHDFRPRQMHHSLHPAHFDPRTGSLTTETISNTNEAATRPEYTFTSGSGAYEAVTPGDLATIYNLKALFASGFTGQGETIAVIENSNIYSTADWARFRSTFGLATYSGGRLTQVHPGGCANPGVNGADGEAILDAEWASAASPSATILVASCADTTTTFGGLIALNNLINSANPPKIISISYGESESENGATANLAYSKAYQAAAAEGISVFVSSGDEGAAASDPSAARATHGVAVSGFASTPYNVAVGGTDFGDTYAGANNTYWSAGDTSTYASAKGYIPEIPWNDSCASQLIASRSGYSFAYGTYGFCNSSTGRTYYQATAAGSGGPSACATGAASQAGVVSGSCKGYGKPGFQGGIVGNPSDGVRDLPDVSLFAANGVWGHYYIYCDSDVSRGGSSCAGAPNTWSGAGGTSFSAPIMAGIQALVNQKTGSAWGNPNPTYYNLARAEYGASGNASCNSSNGKGVSSSCIFYDVQQGDIDVNCTGTVGCYRPTGTNGVLSQSATTFKSAFGAGTGWDFATGLGSVNAHNLVLNWETVKH